MPLVAIVGRPNVGKSTLFNRLTEAKLAIVHDEPGVTRDRIYDYVEWNGVIFSITDTGGYVPDSEDRFEVAIREQVDIATEEADLILFIVDVETGITDLDQAVSHMLRKIDKPVMLVANKSDNQERRWNANVFFQLGLDEVFPISSINGSGTGELLDAIVERLPSPPPEDEEDDRPHIALIGRPNVGKSSLSNALLQEDRSIVTEISGTTRDSINAVMKYHGEEIVLVDTAGLRKRARITENVEFYANLRTERAIKNCDIAVLLIDATQGLEAQDIRVLKQAESLNKGLVLGINKWDLLEKNSNSVRDEELKIRERLKTLDYVPIVTISALNKQRIYKLLDTALSVHKMRSMRVSTSKLNEAMLQAIGRTPPPMYRNRPVKINYVTQVREEPPVITFFCNHPQGVKENYKRYLENQLRKAFSFEGVPLTLTFKNK
ncbi:MAG: ribosome biogenesis GTPase Der [Rhodothermaceae bacterium]|nr:ribosome biogenesis GTPase Der [Rhodothermaceae bacterium]